MREEELSDVYAYPDGLAAPYVRVNGIMALDGAVAVHGVSGPLGSRSDRAVYDELRQLADVVVVGSGTVRSEQYGTVRLPPELRERRMRRCGDEAPPLAIITASADLDPLSPVFSGASAAPLVITTESAPAWRRRRLQDAGAVLLIAGQERVELSVALSSLERRGLIKVLCEGGPRVLGQLVDEGLVDELCLTLSPHLVGGATSLLAGAAGGFRAMRLEGLLTDSGFLFARYRRA
ncbi:pyrimidine reductase family protein [Micromonospora sp. bgisy143]|uniref:pyrimidine reductase family protein n=1 Tax=Micromonospora sp. bgisy143 TaxID=3413790 RepID=UPI003EBCBFDA